MQKIKAKKAGEMKALGRKLEQQGGSLSALDDARPGRKSKK
jgi:hypothetical protein